MLLLIVRRRMLRILATRPFVMASIPATELFDKTFSGVHEISYIATDLSFKDESLRGDCKLFSPYHQTSVLRWDSCSQLTRDLRLHFIPSL